MNTDVIHTYVVNTDVVPADVAPRRDYRLISLLLSLLAALLMRWPYLLPLDALLFNNDYGQFAWNLWIVAENLLQGRNPYHTEMILYPLGANLAEHTLAAGFGVLELLSRFLSPSDPLTPLYSYRLSIWLGTALLLWCSYLCLRALGSSYLAAASLAFAYAFANFYALHTLHLNHMAGFFIPASALALLRLYRRPSLRRALLAAGLIASCIYFSEFIAYIALAVLTFTLSLLLVPEQRMRLLAGLWRLGLLKTTLAAAFAVLLVTPFLYNWLQAGAEKPPAEAHLQHAANLMGFITPHSGFNPLYGQLFRSWELRIRLGVGGIEAFVGFPLLLLGLLALLYRHKPLVYLTLANALLFFLLSLGPSLYIFEQDYGLTLPYRWLMELPPFTSSRSPGRLVVVALFFWTLFAAVAWRRLEHTCAAWPRLRWRRAGAALLALLSLWIVAERYSPVLPFRRYAPYIVPEALQQMQAGLSLNLPVRWSDGEAVRLQTLHQQPIATAYLARYNRMQQHHIQELIVWERRADCEDFLARGFRNVIFMPTLTESAFIRLEQTLATCDVRVIDLYSLPPDIDAQALAYPVPEGSAANARTSFPLGRGGILLHFDAPQYSRMLELSLSRSGHYEVVFYNAQQRLASYGLHSASGGHSLQHLVFELEAAVYEQGFTKVLVRPLGDYSQLALGHLRGIGDDLWQSQQHISDTERPRQRKLAELATLQTPGSPWDAPGSVRIFPIGLVIDLEALHFAEAIEVSLDHNDTYALHYYRRGRLLASQVIDRPVHGLGGLNVVARPLPAVVREQGLDMVVVYPRGGDGMYSLGHLQLLGGRGRWPSHEVQTGSSERGYHGQ